MGGATRARAQTGTAANGSGTITVYLNGEKQEARTPPIVLNGRTLVHIRETFQWLGATVWWNPTDQSIHAWRHEDEVALKIGQPTALVNGRAATLDQPPILYRLSSGPARRGESQVTLVPLRFVSQALGAEVKYDAGARRVDIRMEGFGTEPVYKPGDRVEYLAGHTWQPGVVRNVRVSERYEPSYQVEVTEKSGRTVTVSVGRSVLRAPR